MTFRFHVTQKPFFKYAKFKFYVLKNMNPFSIIELKMIYFI